MVSGSDVEEVGIGSSGATLKSSPNPISRQLKGDISYTPPGERDEPSQALPSTHLGGHAHL